MVSIIKCLLKMFLKIYYFAKIIILEFDSFYQDQYKTVYMALLEAFRGRLRAEPVDFFLKEFQDHSCYLNHGEVSKKLPFALEFEVI